MTHTSGNKKEPDTSERRGSYSKKMKHKNNINIGVRPETHKILKDLQSDLGVKSLNDVICYLLENVE